MNTWVKGEILKLQKCEKKKCLAKFYLNGQNEENGNSYMQTLNEWNQKISM